MRQRRGFVKGLATGALGWAVGGRIAGELGVAQAYAALVPFIASAEAATPDSLFALNQATIAPDTAAALPQGAAAGNPHPPWHRDLDPGRPCALKGGHAVAGQIALH